jgi:hypothetical protein
LDLQILFQTVLAVFKWGKHITSKTWRNPPYLHCIEQV